MFHWANPKKNTRRSAFQNGARIEIASFSEWLANMKCCAQRKARKTKTLRSKKRRANGDRELFRMAREKKSRSFQNGLRIEDAAHKEKAREWRSRAFQNGSREEIASFSEWFTNRKNAAHKEKAREWRSRAFQNGSRVEIASFSEWFVNGKNTEMKKINASLQPG